jgi:3-(methylthio)propanoyl-CoA dehydrogenase
VHRYSWDKRHFKTRIFRMTYVAPLADQRFALDTIADIQRIAALPMFQSATPDMVEAILSEAGKFSANVFAPLNRIGDTQGAAWSDGNVTLPEGYRAAYQQYVAGGWNTLGANPAFGGQGLPFVLATAVMEQVQSANMAFSLCSILTAGAIEALQAHASHDLQRIYLAKLISGEWTGTMNLTEPQAGSDVGALRSKAERHADGSYRIHGQKIFITWGEHDCADNIIHLVLARLPNAPPGTKGISLFVVPKRLVKSDGSLGAQNDLRCVSIEHKLGIKASPTCTMSYGDSGNCVGYIVGAENAGMRAMFTMMNHARINVGLQGVAIAERAYQHALWFAKDRVQSAKFGGGRTAVRIIEHADVRRMLMTMKATIEAIRALAYLNAAAVDIAHGETDADRQKAALGLADLLTPVTKAYATDMGVELSSLAVQVFGGMGFIEETGAAQHMRDARIAPIYEGTNGIQALDLVGRKLPMDGGAHWKTLFADIRDFIKSLPKGGDLGQLAPYLDDALESLNTATIWMLGNQADAVDDSAAGATPYLRMFGLVMGGYLLAKQAVAAEQRLQSGEGDPAFLKAKIITARYFAEQILPQAPALLGPVTRGSAMLFALAENQFLPA